MWGAITENIGLKILSLAISIGLWLAFVGKPELSTSVTVPVEYKNVPKKLEISSDIQERVRLDITGPPAKLRADALTNAAAVVDLGGVQQPGEQTFTIDSGSMRLPVGVELLRAVPNQIRLRFETQMKRDVPVQVRLAGEAAPGFELAQSAAHPGKLSVVGPQSEVAGLEYVQTDLIDIGGLSASTTKTVHVFVENSQVRLTGPPRVMVDLVIQRSSGAAVPK